MMKHIIILTLGLLFLGVAGMAEAHNRPYCGYHGFNNGGGLGSGWGHTHRDEINGFPCLHKEVDVTNEPASDLAGVKIESEPLLANHDCHFWGTCSDWHWCYRHDGDRSAEACTSGARVDPLDVGDPAFTAEGEIFANITTIARCLPESDNWPACNVITLEITDEYAEQMNASTTHFADALLAVLTLSSSAHAEPGTDDHDHIHQGSHVHDSQGVHWGYITGIKGNVVEVCFSDDYAELMKAQQI